MDVVTLAASLAQARKQLRNRSHFAILPAPPCAGRVVLPSAFSAVTGFTFQKVYRLYNDAPMVRFVFQNMAAQGSPEENSPGVFTLKANVIWRYLGASTYVPITFNGRRSVTIDQYATLISDPVPVDFGATTGTYFVVRSYITQSGTFLPVAQDGQVVNGWVEGYLAGDQTDTTGNSYGGSTQDRIIFGPIAVCGWSSNGRNNSVFVGGDSIAVGTGWSGPSRSSFTTWALDNASVPAVSGARSGEAVSTILFAGLYAHRLGVAAGCKHAVCNYGTNDIGNGDSLATIKANLIAYWTQLARFGLSIHQTTILPRNASTDGYQTLVNQSLFGGNAAQNTVRQGLNQWLRAPSSAGAGSSARADFPGLTVHDIGAVFEVNSDGSAITINPTTGAISNGVGNFTKVDSTTYVSGTVTSTSGTQKIDDTSKAWAANELVTAGYSVAITADATTPASVGQVRQVAANTATQLTADTAWTTVPSTGATYRLFKAYSTDGIHPTTLGHKLAATAIDTTKFV